MYIIYASTISTYLQFLIPILALSAGPVLANILNKVVDTIDDRIKGKSLSDVKSGKSNALKFLANLQSS